MPELPEWQPLDGIATAVSEGRNGGRVVGIVASAGAVSSGWAEDGALSIARAWSRAGQKVVLVDGALQSPSLHAATGVPNGEGLSDATLFGASVGRVARQVEEGAFFLITAGTVVADTNAVVRSRRWDQLSKGFVEAGVTLGVFLRDGEPGAAAFLGSASEIVVLSGRTDEPPRAVRDLEKLVTLVAGPDAAEGALAVAAGDAGELSAVSLKRTASAGRGRLYLLILLVLALVAALLAMFGIIPIPGLSPQAAGSVPASEAVTG